MRADNPIFDGTGLGVEPAWTFIQVAEFDGWHVKVHGRYIADAETGKPAVFRPPMEISTMKEFHEWASKVKAAVGRMSGKAVVL